MNLISFECSVAFWMIINVCVKCENATTAKNVIETTAKSTSSDLLAKGTSYKSPFANVPRLLCPGFNDPIRPFVPIPCKKNKECSQLGNKNLLCCRNRCVKGILAPPPEPSHSPTWFGFVERTCPVEYVPEIFSVKKCHSDADCGSRICCPEKMPNGFVEGFCRTAQPKLDKLPAVKSFMEPMKDVMAYMQCTPPPPPLFDVFPRQCENVLDCFPNLCCQERGKKFCRPPKRSLLTLLTSVAQVNRSREPDQLMKFMFTESYPGEYSAEFHPAGAPMTEYISEM